jgi:hypothetical protein
LQPYVLLSDHSKNGAYSSALLIDGGEISLVITAQSLTGEPETEWIPCCIFSIASPDFAVNDGLGFSKGINTNSTPWAKISRWVILTFWH